MEYNTININSASATLITPGACLNGRNDHNEELLQMKNKDGGAIVDAIIENEKPPRKTRMVRLPDDEDNPSFSGRASRPASKTARNSAGGVPQTRPLSKRKPGAENAAALAEQKKEVARRGTVKNPGIENLKGGTIEVRGMPVPYNEADAPYGSGKTRFPQETPVERPYFQNNKTLLIAVINTLIATIFALSINYYTEARIRDREIRKSSAILYSDIQNSAGNTEGIIAEQDKNPETQSVLEVPHSGLLGSATENFLIYLNGLREPLGDKNYSAILEYYNTLLTLEAVRKKYLYYQISGYTQKSKPMQTSYASYCELVREIDGMYKTRAQSFESVKKLFRSENY